MDKIVFIIPNMTGGGTERVISLLSTEYIKRGFQVAIMQFAGYPACLVNWTVRVVRFLVFPNNRAAIRWFRSEESEICADILRRIRIVTFLLFV